MLGRRLSVALGVLLLLVGCSTRPWWESSSHTNCTPAAEYRVAGHVGSIGNCAAQPLPSAQTITVHRGAQIDLHMTCGRPCLYWPVESSNSMIVRKVSTRSLTGEVSFSAAEDGTALLSGMGYCRQNGRQNDQGPTCSLLKVIVTA
jgi:hypothetical protein